MNQDSETRTRAPKLRSRLRQVTCEAILAAAEETLSERGLHDAGMVEIAARAGVSVGTLYNHFKDRDALLSALVAGRRDELIARIDRGLAESADAPFRAQLTAFTAAFFDHVEAHRRFLQVYFSDEKRRGLSKDNAPHVDIRRRLEKLMKAGVRQGALSREGASILVAAFMGMMRGIFIQDSECRSAGAESGATPETIVHLFLDGAGSKTR